MSVYHCPLCPLIFEYRTEAEWHLREEHRSRVDEAADRRVELAAAVRRLDWEYLRHLRSSAVSPSVTLLLSTAPAATMTVLDIARLRQLAERARRRLFGEPHRETAAGVVEDRLSTAVSAAESQPTDRGIAVFVNPRHIGIVSLPFAPRDRHVVDRGFATRDLEYALRRHPRYRVLLLGPHPRVLEGHVHQLSEPEIPAGGRGPRVHPPAEAPVSPDPDLLLQARVGATGVLPLVVVGDRRHLDRFRRRSAFGDEAIAEIARPRFHKTRLADLVAGPLERIRRDQQSLAVAKLLHADMQAQIAWGVQAAWNAIHNRTADRLWVEHDFAVPGRLTPGPFGVEITTDPAEPGAIDDLVDALLTEAAGLGAEIHLLDRHTLARPEPVAVNIPVPAAAHGPSPRSLAAT